MGIVQEDGTFELVCGSLGERACPANTTSVSNGNRRSLDSRKGPPRTERGPDQLKGRYSNPKTSGLHATIEAQQNELEPFGTVTVRSVTQTKRLHNDDENVVNERATEDGQGKSVLNLKARDKLGWNRISGQIYGAAKNLNSQP